jgi:uncharacterized membrane protein YecN with MAPEG domain
MTLPHIVPVYAGLLGLMLVALSWRIMRMRARLEIMVGDGADRDLNVAVRMQGNFIEYVPMALMLLYFNEAVGWSPYIIHGLALILLIARVAHVHGMSRENAMGKGRRLGARMTFAVIIVSSLMCMISSFMVVH